VPEGDTIWRAAHTLHKALAGRSVIAARSPIAGVSASGLAGRTIVAVESHGKNLLIRLDDGRVVYTHMRMSGSWHIYQPGERWQRPERQARLVLETERYVAVCFNAPVVEILTAAALRRHAVLSTLGPDLLSAAFDAASARQRLRALGSLPIGEALMRQTALAGIGNVYKSETLFLCGVNPFSPVRELEDAALDRMIAKARALMSANLHARSGPGRRLERSEGFWVYRRCGRPCRRCGAVIRMRRQGADARSTYWCPTCQPVAAPLRS
jgi:endonuclease-8